MNTDALRSNYQAVVDAATAGGFGPPPVDEWNAEQIIAHLTANDDLLVATTTDLLAGRPVSYDNALAIDTDRLSALVDECGGRDGVIERLRTSSTRLVELAEQIDDDLASTMLPVHILDGTIVQVDQPLPIAALFGAQALVHLPAHLKQLESLLP
jgi:hypothetical protein